MQEHYGFHVANLNIAQVKQKHGIIERENYNKPKSEDSRQPGCPKEKVKAIEAALRHFGLPENIYPIAALEALGKQGIQMIYDNIHQVLAQGNYVLAVSEGTFGGAPTSYYDLWRVENGCRLERR